ncbi:MAG: hypothetical protein US02_C0014G0002 [Candidatus Levybacteria bacterium GW2011_GWA2_36_13]|nr:MAG: hypothetical protein US02_C0014G0002 [Candidatus Levybacteria bacterium GW2011_GWA2_36_13]
MNIRKNYWGIEEISENKIDFYHVLLSRHSVKTLAKNITSFQEIACDSNEKFSLVFEQSEKDKVNKELLNFLIKLESKFLNTPIHGYTLSPKFNNFLKEYFLAFEASLALILMFKVLNREFLTEDWHLLNSTIGGIFVNPYTIVLNEDHAKVIHPINFENYYERNEIERIIAVSIKGIMERVEEADPKHLGEALLSYIKDKTGLDSKTIAEIIDRKSQGIRLATNSPLLL